MPNYGNREAALAGGREALKAVRSFVTGGSELDAQAVESSLVAAECALDCWDEGDAPAATLVSPRVGLTYAPQGDVVRPAAPLLASPPHPHM